LDNFDLSRNNILSYFPSLTAHAKSLNYNTKSVVAIPGSYQTAFEINHSISFFGISKDFKANDTIFLH
jgi:hypothetical protein